MINPYIGVTGVMTAQEAGTLLGTLPKSGRHQLMIGVLVSSKTLAGQKNKWPGRFPAITAIADIFIAHPWALNLVHYSTDTPESLASEACGIMQLAGPNCHGLQLNVCWPEPSQLVDLRMRQPRAKLILQLSTKAMAAENNDPNKIVERLAYHYHELIDGVLFDPSSGLGRPFNPAMAVQFITTAKDVGLQCHLGVAGGLSSETIGLVSPVAKVWPTVSVDAEGRLRTPQPEDALDMRLACNYVQAACAVLAGA